MKKFLLLSVILSNFGFNCFSAPLSSLPYSGLPEETVDKLVGAIYKLEGGDKTKFPYGIKSINTKGDKEVAERICRNTVRNNWQRYQKAGAKGSYLDFLGNVYCPASADKTGNTNWKRNIRKISGLDF